MREPGNVQKYDIKDGGTVHIVVKNPTPVCILYASLLQHCITTTNKNTFMFATIVELLKTNVISNFNLVILSLLLFSESCV